MPLGKHLSTPQFSFLFLSISTMLCIPPGVASLFQKTKYKETAYVNQLYIRLVAEEFDP